LIPKKPDDRVKTNRRDAAMLSKLHRAGELTAVWVPDAAHEAMRGVAFINAVTIVAEIGDFARFSNPRQLMAYVGLVPSEHSSGDSVRRGGITKAGNGQARRALIEGAMQARVSRKLHDRIEDLPQRLRDTAWKAQVRLCGRYRRLVAKGKPRVVVTTAIAREMIGFIWAIARQVQLQTP
jgi:transposase